MSFWYRLRRSLGVHAPEDDPAEDARSRGEAWPGAEDQAQFEARVEAIRLITGDIRWRYDIVNTIRSYARHVHEPGTSLRPTASTDTALRLLQEEALEVGATAVIHLQVQIIYYEVSLRRQPVPAWETHAFGTAVRIIGPPSAEGGG